MADGIRTHYKLWDGTKWVKYWFTTSADAVHETGLDGSDTGRRFVTPAQKDLLESAGTNVANSLLTLNASARVDASLLPDLSGTYALVDHNHNSAYAPINHNHNDDYAPVVHDHDTVYSKLGHTHSGIYEPVFTKKTAFNKDFAGTGTATTVARSDHNHDEAYEPVITKNSAFNLNKATKAQAEAGAVDTVLMTPLRTKEAILKLAPAPADATESIKGIVKLSSDFDPTTADANTALSQAGAKALKAYADTVAGMGFRPQEPCYYAIAGTDSMNYQLSGNNGGLFQANKRILVAGRTNTAENGIYTTSSGDWIKDPDSVKSGAMVFVTKGTSEGTNDTIWVYNSEQKDYFLFSRIDVAQESATIKPVFTENSYTLNIKNNAIITDHIADAQVTEAKLTTDAVTTNKIKDGNVTDAKLADNAVTTDKIYNGAVTANKLATNSVTNIKIKDGAVTSAKIANGSITKDKIVDDAIRANHINDYEIMGTHIQPGIISNNHIGDTAGIALVKLQPIASKSLVGNAGTGSLPPTVLTAAEVRSILKVAENANHYIHPDHTGDVTSSSDGATTIVAGAVTEAKLANGAVATSKLASGAVTEAKLATGAVTEAKLATSVKELIKKITVGTSAPSDPNVGDVWLDTSVS